MKRFKHIIALALAAALLLSFAACGKGGENGGENGEKTAEPDQGAVVIEPSASPELAATRSPAGTDEPEAQDLSEGMTCYSDAFQFYCEIATAMAYTGGDYIRINNERVGDDPDDPNYIDFSYMPFDSINMATMQFIGDETTEEEVRECLESFGFQDIRFEKPAQGQYRITFEDEGEDGVIQRYENLMRYENGAVRFELICDGVTVDFEEFISMGNGLFALQDMTNRAIVCYRDGTLVSMRHSTLRSEFDFDTNRLTSWSKHYDASADSIWGRTDLDTDWVDERNAAGDVYLIFDYADTIMHITGFRIIGFGEDAVFEPREPIEISK